jgi:hypothetical protein
VDADSPAASSASSAQPGGALAMPIAVLAVVVSVAVAVQVGHFTESPGVPLFGIAFALSALRRRARVLLFAPITVAAFLAFPPFGRGFFSFELFFAFAFLLALAPLAAISLRRRPGASLPVFDASRRRSPWIVAAAMVAPLIELTMNAEFDLTPDPNSGPDRCSGAVLSIYAAALLAALVLSVADVRDLRHALVARGDGARRFARMWRTPLARSLAIDVLAIAVATSFLVTRVIVATDRHLGRHSSDG